MWRFIVKACADSKPIRAAAHFYVIMGNIMKNLSKSQTKWIVFLTLCLFCPIYIGMFFVPGGFLSLLLTFFHLINNILITKILSGAGLFFCLNIIFYSIVLFVSSLLLSKLIFRIGDPKKRGRTLILFVIILLIVSFLPIYSLQPGEQANIWYRYHEILLTIPDHLRLLYLKR